MRFTCVAFPMLGGLPDRLYGGDRPERAVFRDKRTTEVQGRRHNQAVGGIAEPPATEAGGLHGDGWRNVGATIHLSGCGQRG